MHDTNITTSSTRQNANSNRSILRLIRNSLAQFPSHRSQIGREIALSPRRVIFHMFGTITVALPRELHERQVRMYYVDTRDLLRTMRMRALFARKQDVVGAGSRIFATHIRARARAPRVCRCAQLCSKLSLFRGINTAGAHVSGFPIVCIVLQTQICTRLHSIRVGCVNVAVSPFAPFLSLHPSVTPLPRGRRGGGLCLHSPLRRASD